jgi:two-component sensor histidine kinase
LNIDTVIPLGLILNELITNCYKYAFKGREKGNIEIRLQQKDKMFSLSISDDGVGMPPNFDIKKARSLGLNLVNGLVRQLDGALTFQTGENGTRFLVNCAN